MFSFIILHYKNIDDTICCLEALHATGFKDSHFIVVDNNTLNSQEEKLINKYTNDVLKLNNNYGYAIANNRGIEYAREKYNSRFYIIINNDVIIKQKEFLNIISNDYNKYNFDMLGTWIDSISGESVNPFPALRSKIQIEAELSKCNKLIKIYSSRLLTFLLNVYICFKHLIKKPIKPSNGALLEKNVPLHGCAIVFSKKYIEKYQYPFDNRTFLFHEEEFLYKRVINDKLISVYDPCLKVFHKEGSSIENDNKNNRKSKLFRESERLKSLKILLNDHCKK